MAFAGYALVRWLRKAARQCADRHGSYRFSFSFAGTVSASQSKVNGSWRATLAVPGSGALDGAFAMVYAPYRVLHSTDTLDGDLRQRAPWEGG